MPAPGHAVTTTVAVGGAATGRTLDGVGALSGGRGNGQLLIDHRSAADVQLERTRHQSHFRPMPERLSFPHTRSK
jgi:hypothetical protein